MIFNSSSLRTTDTVSGDKLGFMATLGHIGKFDPVEESISVYLECMKLFFAANGIKDEKQVAVLLLVIEPKIYALLHDLLAPEKPQDKSVAALSETLRKHFQPKHVMIAEHFCSTGETKAVASHRQIISRSLTTYNTLLILAISR